jgi:hypothetical protein
MDGFQANCQPVRLADGWCWFVLREEYCWLVAGGWFVLREKYCWLVADKPSEQAVQLVGEDWREPLSCMHGGLQLHVRAYLPADTIRRCWLLLLRFIDRVAI